MMESWLFSAAWWCWSCGVRLSQSGNPVGVASTLCVSRHRADGYITRAFRRRLPWPSISAGDARRRRVQCTCPDAAQARRWPMSDDGQSEHQSGLVALVQIIGSARAFFWLAAEKPSLDVQRSASPFGRGLPAIPFNRFPGLLPVAFNLFCGSPAHCSCTILVGLLAPPPLDLFLIPLSPSSSSPSLPVSSCGASQSPRRPRCGTCHPF
jgi:hypothetical protein